MELIHDHLHGWDESLACVMLPVERGTLAKRRWRGTARDGTEFGFDLQYPLADGDVFHLTGSAFYRIEQLAEPVLEVALDPSAPAAARLGWIVGNLHFPIAIEGTSVLLIDDPALRALLTREAIAFTPKQLVFRPLGGGHSHSH